jgi:hypothetical protein
MFGTAWKYGHRLSGAAGLLVTVLALALSFVPPSDVSSVWLFELKLAGGFLLLAGGARACFTRYKIQRKRV